MYFYYDIAHLEQDRHNSKFSYIEYDIPLEPRNFLLQNGRPPQTLS